MLCPGLRLITDTEGRSQFSLWCILAAPLMLGTDVRNMTAATLATISNAEAIAIDQDPLGIQGMSYTPSTPPSANVTFYYKPLAPVENSQSIAIAVLNRGLTGVPGQNLSFADLGFASAQRIIVRDIWAGTSSPAFQSSIITRSIDSHETLLLKLTPVMY
jgi:alpha-galactosidase